MAYEVSLDVFEGPIDLLLHLITRRRVDIYDVSLAAITDEYLATLKRMQAMDLDVATGFLVIAATLLELKSARLLPAPPSELDDDLLEERDRLLARLVECSTFREAGTAIAAGLAAGAHFHPREVTLEETFIHSSPDLLANTSLDDLARAAADVFAVIPEVELELSHVQPIRASVRDAIAALAGALADGKTESFSVLCGGATARIDVVVRFLALLELFKAGAVTIDQAERFGDIRARWTGDASLDEVVSEAQEYVLATGDA
jgi:segregation and condensation protein A